MEHKQSVLIPDEIKLSLNFEYDIIENYQPLPKKSLSAHSSMLPQLLFKVLVYNPRASPGVAPTLAGAGAAAGAAARRAFGAVALELL
jgi:hypothetical protein